MPIQWTATGTVVTPVAELLWHPQRLWNVKPSPGAMISWNHPLASGLVNCLLFNEGGGAKVYDLANASYVATLTAGGTLPAWTTDGQTIGLNTAGTSSPNLQITAPDTAYLGNLSILWAGSVRVGSTFHNLAFKSTGNGASNNPFEFRTDNTNPPRLQLVDADASNLNTWTCATTFSVGAPHQLGVSRPAALNTAPTFYIDGVKGAAASGGGSAVTATGTNAVINILRRADGGTNLDGKISLFYIWRRLLLAEEFQSLYHNPYQFLIPIRFH